MGEALQASSRRRCQWWGAAALVLSTPAVPQAPSEQIEVGRVTVVYWTGARSLAVALADLANRPQAFAGLPDTSSRSLRIVLARNGAHLDSLLNGRAPRWSEGVAIPDARTIFLNADRRGRGMAAIEGVLRHELAHLALREYSGRAQPRWFEEGYASFATGEWSWLQAVGVSWEIVRGRIPTLVGVERALRRGSRGEAESAYLMAGSAVALLHRWGRDRGLEPFLETLSESGNFDASVQQTYGVNVDQFEVFWRRELRQRYGWLAVLAGVGIFWGPFGVLILWIGVIRRRRNLVRRISLDDDGDDAQLLDVSEVRD